MTKKKVYIHRDLPNEATTAKYKNFNKVLGNYQKLKQQRASYKNRKYFLGLSLIVVVTVLVFWTNDDQKETKPTNDFTISGIHPPLPEHDIAYSRYDIDPSKDTFIVHHSGSLIHLKAGILVDKDGNEITEKVNIKYREFHNPLEGYLAGIPMNYDSAGAEYVFESAGMFDIRAKAQGKEVFIKAGEQIAVDMASKTDINTNFYYFNESSKAWENQGKDQLSYLPMLNDSGTLISVVPKKGQKGFYEFTLEVDNDLYPELAVFEGLYFQVDTSNNSFSEKLYDVLWDEIFLDKSTNHQYTLTLVANAEHVINAEPVLDSANFESAKQLFDEKYHAYCRKLKEQKEERKKYLANLLKQNAQIMEAERNKVMAQLANEREQKKLNKKYLAVLDSIETAKRKQVEDSLNRLFEQKSTMLEASNYLIRKASITSFGLYNSDCPRIVREVASNSITVIYKNKKTGEIILPIGDIQKAGSRPVCYAFLNRNLRYREWSGKYVINHQEDYFGWFMTEKGNMVLVSQDQIKRFNKKGVKEGDAIVVEVYEDKQTFIEVVNTLFNS